MLKTVYSHLCEKAFLSQNGNLNIIGIFESIASQKFPVSFPHLSIVTSLQGKAGAHQMMIKIINSDTQEDMIKAISLNINAKAKKNTDPDKLQNLRIIGDINNLVIKDTGNYEVQIFLNGDLDYKIPFTVQKAVKPIPEGR